MLFLQLTFYSCQSDFISSLSPVGQMEAQSPAGERLTW